MISAMQRSGEQLRNDAWRIWTAGVEAVKPRRLIPESLTVDGNDLWVGEQRFDLREIDRIAVVGAGKAGASMTVAVEQTLGPSLLREKQVCGLVNVPADCLQETSVVRLHAARPAGLNEPTASGVEGTRQILELVGSLGPRDLCLCLISGGGSALLPLPRAGISLETKLWLTREISSAGGDIHHLNTVRRELSAVKGGGLARACKASALVTLTLSDVMGDDLEVIASGPTVPRKPTPAAALAVLRNFDLLRTDAGRQVERVFADEATTASEVTHYPKLLNLIIGKNSTAVDSAGILAEQLGYSHAMISGDREDNSAEAVGRWLAENGSAMRKSAGPDCLISGGESTVELVSSAKRGKGGRNQQVALAALEHLEDWTGLALVSGGTDGEDGPTDAAGARVDMGIAAASRDAGLTPGDYLNRNDAYHFFEKIDGLIKTGPTHTNVCDLRVLCVDQESAPS